MRMLALLLLSCALTACSAGELSALRDQLAVVETAGQTAALPLDQIEADLQELPDGEAKAEALEAVESIRSAATSEEAAAAVDDLQAAVDQALLTADDSANVGETLLVLGAGGKAAAPFLGPQVGAVVGVAGIVLSVLGGMLIERKRNKGDPPARPSRG